MNRQNLRKVDLQLMLVFEAIMHEHNVSRVAERLHMAQPTVSAALARLRSFFDDALFVRVGHKMEPTARAIEIFRHIAPALDHFSQALSLTEVFDPTLSDAVFRAGFSDDVELAFMPKLLQKFRRHAPHAKLIVTPVDRCNVADQLNNGTITLAVSQTQNLPARAKRRTLRRSRLFVLSADLGDTPLELTEYCARPHIHVSPAADVPGAIDRRLEALGLTRDVVMSVPRYSVLPYILLENPEFLAVLPEYAARALARLDGLACKPLPLDIPPWELSMVWLSIHDNDPAQKWLRGVVNEHISPEVASLSQARVG